MDPTIDMILQVSNRDFLHDVLRKLCMDNGFVRQAVLENFAASPSVPSPDNSGEENVNADDKQDSSIAVNGEGTQSGNQDDVKPEAAHGRRSSLYDIPLAPSAQRAPSAPITAPVTPAPASPSRIVTRGQVNTPANSFMVIDDDNNVNVVHDDGDESYAASSRSSSDEGEVDGVLEEILNGSDGLSSSPGEDRPRPTIERRMSPTFFNSREFAREEQFDEAPANQGNNLSRPRPETAENKTRQNLYQTIYKHQEVSEEIERLTQRLATSRDPAEIQLTSQRLNRLDLQRCGCREAIESALSAEERLTPESRRAAIERYRRMAAENRNRIPGLSPSRKRNAPDDDEHAEEERETLVARRARIAREANERTQRRLEDNRERRERIERLTQLHDIAKQAARKGAKRLKLAEKAEARRVREVKARKRREAQEERAMRRGRGRGRGRGRQQNNASATPATRSMPRYMDRDIWDREFSY